MKRTPLKPGRWSNSRNQTSIPRRRTKSKRKKITKAMTEFQRRQHRGILARIRSKRKGPSVQTLKRIKGQYHWSLWVRKVQVVYLLIKEGAEYGRCEKCGRFMGLQGDHVVPKSNLKIILHDPLNGQVLCEWCNSDKGSIHNEHTDYRSAAMRRFYARVAALHWEQYGAKGIWQLNAAAKAWLRSGKNNLVIPGINGPHVKPD